MLMITRTLSNVMPYVRFNSYNVSFSSQLLGEVQRYNCAEKNLEFKPLFNTGLNL